MSDQGNLNEIGSTRVIHKIVLGKYGRYSSS